MDKEAVLAEIDEVMGRFPGAVGGRPSQPSGAIAAFLACIERIAPQQSYKDLARRESSGSTPATAQRLAHLLLSVRADIEAGYVRTLEQRIRGVVFEDFLSMAEAINETPGMHPAPALVLAVGVLEDHVRTLAAAKGIDVEKANGDARSFEDLVSDLARSTDERPTPVITRTDAKSIRAWYAQRTDAAHGKFDEVVPERVPGIIVGVREFVQRHRA